MNFEGGLGVSLVRLELWELDQFGNEIRKILETTSNSITFSIFGNYKLKRYFEARDKGQVSNPTTTTQTYTITITQGTTTIREWSDWHVVRAKGMYQDADITITPWANWYIKYDGKELVEGQQYVEKWDIDKVHNPNYVSLTVHVYVQFKPNAPYDASVTIRIYYITWNA
jgi:hypothetical protein